jgi:hypothetical protein
MQSSNRNEEHEPKVSYGIGGAGNIRMAYATGAKDRVD